MSVTTEHQSGSQFSQEISGGVPSQAVPALSEQLILLIRRGLVLLIAVSVRPAIEGVVGHQYWRTVPLL